MGSQLVFISLFLGLISGPQIVELQVGPAITSVHLLLEGRQVAVLQQPPWRATIDFGPAIAPGELVAVGYDANQNEVTRVAQTVNLPRLPAEFVITLNHDGQGVPVSAALRWENIRGSKPAQSSLTLDGKPLALDSKNRANLPPLDMNHPHVFAAEIRFEDGLVARRELVAGGAIGDTAESDLTPIGIRQSASAPPANLGDCFTSAGSPVRVAAIEKSPALVVVVADPDPREAMPFEQTRLEGLRLIPLDLGTWMRVLWPVAERFTTTRKTSALLFPPSADVDAKSRRMVWLLTRFYSGRSDEKAPRQMADAVGVAGLDVISGAHRRAVVLVLSRYKDSSTHDAASIRRYLSSIGVPLFVWSITGPRPESRDAWGEIEDISTLPGLSAAAARLRADLASQRVAWVAADSVAALRLQPTGRCAITAMAAR